MRVEPLTHEEIEQLEAQHDKIARMIAELDGAQLEAESEYCLAIVDKANADSRVAMAREALRTVKGRRMGLSTLLRRME